MKLSAGICTSLLDVLVASPTGMLNFYSYAVVIVSWRNLMCYIDSLDYWGGLLIDADW